MSTEGPYNYASSSTQRGAGEFNFLISRNPGEVLASPVLVESSSQTAGLRLACADSGAVTISGVAPVGSPALNSAVTTIGVPSSTQAVSVLYNSSQGTDNLYVGRPGVSSVQVRGSISNGGSGSVFMNSTVGTETLVLGANATSYNNITLAASGVTTLAQPPNLLGTYNPGYQVIGTLGSGVGVTLTNPTVAGLYAVMVGTTSTDGPSVAAQASCLAYYNGTTWNLGGCFFGPANGGGNSEIAPTPTTKANLIFKQTSGNNILGFACSMIPVFNGPISIPF